jgi:thioredoxin reductase (NADPH)
VRWRSSATGEVETRRIRHVFSMTGAEPNTAWVEGCVALDDASPRRSEGSICVQLAHKVLAE